MWRRTAAPSERESIRAARIVTLAATGLFLLIVCRWRPWDLFDRAAFSADFYDEQARVFLRGGLAVDPDVAGIEGFLVGGHTYLYYGPFLALLRLPFALVAAIFGDHAFFGRLTRLSLVVGYATYLTAAFHLLRASASAHKRTVGSCADTEHGSEATGDATKEAAGEPWRGALFVAIAASSPALFLSGWVSVYHETEMWAAAFAVWAAVGALRLTTEPTRRNALLTAGSIIAATLTRAPIGIGMAIGVGIVALLRWRDRPRVWATAIAGCVLGVGVHMAVNVAKFHSLLSLPADRQVLTLQDPTRAAWFADNGGSFFGLRFLPTTLVHYLRPDTIRFERLLPIVRFGPEAHELGSHPLETITPASSLTASATLLTIAAVVGVVILLRRRAWVALALTTGAAAAAVPSFAIGFIANRYLVDMLPMLLIPASAAVAALAWPTRRAIVGLVIALVAWGVVSNVALATWVQNLKEPGFTAWRYSVDDRVFGNPAPGIVTYTAGTEVPRNGIVAVDAVGTECRSVYVAEDGKWVALEHSEGFRRLSGTLRLAANEVTVVEGDSWALTATTANGTIRFHLGGILGEPLEWDGDPVDTVVVADGVEGVFSVTANGHASLLTFAPPPRPMRPGTAFEPTTDRNESLCRQLEARR